MLHRQFVLDPDADYPLFITAKQYWCPEFEANWDIPEAFTLVVLHSTSFHKETWEPTLQELFDGVKKHAPNTFKIKSAWVIECPNHGQTAALNDAALQRPPFYRAFGCEKYAEAVHRFMSMGTSLSIPFNFRSQKLLGIGHSLGGVVISILPTLEPAFQFSSIILVEPMLSPQGPEAVHELKLSLIKGAYERRDVWPSRADALKYLRSRRRTECWDPRVLELYVEHGLKVHPAASHELGSYEGVVLACSRDEEVTMYRDPTGSAAGLDGLNSVCGRIPVSVIFGGENDFIPRVLQEALIDPASGRSFQIVTRIEGAGHLIPQQVPGKLSEAIFDILLKTSSSTVSRL